VHSPVCLNFTAKSNFPYAQLSQDASASSDSYPMDKLLAKLSEQNAELSDQNCATRSGAHNLLPTPIEHESSCNSLPMTPATEGFQTTAPSTRPASATIEEPRTDVNEVLRLKLQLAHAQNQISKLDQELAQSRTVETDQTTQSSAPGRGSAPASRDSPWSAAEDTQSDTSDALSTSAFNRARGIWSQPKARLSGSSLQTEPTPGSWLGGRPSQEYSDPCMPFPGPDGYRAERTLPDGDMPPRQGGNRRGNRYDGRMPGSTFGGSFGGPMGQFDPMNGNPMSMHPAQPPMGVAMYPPYQQPPIGTTLSPHASEFTSKAGWKSEVCFYFRLRMSHSDRLQIALQDGPTYLPPTEPLNYRRLLDRNVNCN
jgi:hypothetical protein